MKNILGRCSDVKSFYSSDTVKYVGIHWSSSLQIQLSCPETGTALGQTFSFACCRNILVEIVIVRRVLYSHHRDLLLQ